MHVLVIDTVDVHALRDVEQHVHGPGLELRVGREVRPHVERAPPRRVDQRRRRGPADPSRAS